MPKIAIATRLQAPSLTESDQLFAAAFTRLGAEVEAAP